MSIHTMMTGASNMLSTTTRSLALACAVAFALGACATPEEIDRVQPDLIEKSTLLGSEWYTLQTVVDGPYAAGRAFPGLQGALDRGVFEIEEDYLYLYRTYEFVEGVEEQGIRSDVDEPLLDENGDPVTYEKTLPDGTTTTAVRYIYRSNFLSRWNITAHTDVRKSYNPATGEESNVLTEDSSEKHWYERKYMRVDFATNSSMGSAFGMSAGIYDGETGPEDLKFRMEDDGSYMDFSIRHIVEAPTVYYGAYGYIPKCLFYSWFTQSYYECDREEWEVRYSYMRVDADSTYKPMYHDDQMLGKFGYFRVGRAEWDETYGTTYSDAHRLGRRFAIWEDYIDEDGDGDLDYEKMTPKPIVYYLTEEFPRELVGGSIDLADQWNKPFMEVVQHYKPEYDGRMFILCENNMTEAAAAVAADPDAPLAETDPDICKDMERPKRLGDLRYNLLSSINDPTTAGLYGYGPMHADPITGETVHANAYMYTANIRLGARNAVDMIEYASGVQNFVEVTQAQHITTGIKAKSLKATMRAPRSSGAADLEAARAASRAVLPPQAESMMTDLGLEMTDMDEARVGMAKMLGTDQFDWVFKNPTTASMMGFPVDDLENLNDPDGLLDEVLDPLVFNSEDAMLKAQKRHDHLGAEAICMGDHFDNSFRGLAAEYQAKYDKAVCEGLQDRDDLVFDYSVFDQPGAYCGDDASVCGEGQLCTFLDQGLAAGKYCVTPCSTSVLLEQLRKEIRRVNQISEFQYWDPNALYTDVKDAMVMASQNAMKEQIEVVREEVFQEVFARMWSTIALHEVGHNVGLRHNFSSSTDSLNYFEDYWSIRGNTNAEGEWFPGTLWTSDTEAETAQRMREYQQTTVMEYGAAFNARHQGLGTYDHAAIHFGYGELLTAFDNPPLHEEWAPLMRDPEDDDPTEYAISGTRQAPLARALRHVHYTNLPSTFGGVDNMQARHLVYWKDMILKDDDGAAVTCEPMDNPYDSSVCGVEGSYCMAMIEGYFCSNPEITEVPFRFCSDEYNRSSPDCNTRDEGTDVFDMVLNSIEDYESYWPFRAYMRDSDFFFPGTSYYGRIQGDMAFWRKHFEHWAYDYARYNKGDWWANNHGDGLAWHEDVNGGLGKTLAVKEIFTHIANIFGRPSDSYYGWNNQKERYEPVISNGKNSYSNIFQVREDQGARPMYPSYDFSGYRLVPRRAGTFYDRMAALQWMTYPTMMFVRGRDKGYDIRRFRLNFADIWPQRVANILSGLVTSDPVPFGWCIEHDGVPPTEGGNGDPIRVKPRMWFGTQAELDEYYSNCVALTPEPEYSFPTTQYRLPALATIYGMSWMSGTFNRSYTDRTRLWLEGDGADISIPSSFEVVSFTEPFSGKTYKSAYDPNEFDPSVPPTPRETVPASDFEEHGHTYFPAAWMVGQAQEQFDAYGGNMSALSDDFPYSDLQQTIGRMEIIRGLYRYLEFGM